MVAAMVVRGRRYHTGRRPMKLRSHLVLLVVVALLPVLAFGFAMLAMLGRDRQAELHESLVTRRFPAVR